MSRGPNKHLVETYELRGTWNDAGECPSLIRKMLWKIKETNMAFLANQFFLQQSWFCNFSTTPTISVWLDGVTQVRVLPGTREERCLSSSSLETFSGRTLHPASGGAGTYTLYRWAPCRFAHFTPLPDMLGAARRCRWATRGATLGRSAIALSRSGLGKWS